MAHHPWSSRSETRSAPADPHYLYRVDAPLGSAAQKLLTRGFDVLEGRDGDDLFVIGTKSTAQELRAAGFPATIEQTLRAPRWTPPTRRGQAPVLTQSVAEETYYGGYRTVNAQFAHLNAVAQQHPSWPPWSTTATRGARRRAAPATTCWPSA